MRFAVRRKKNALCKDEICIYYSMLFAFAEREMVCTTIRKNACCLDLADDAEFCTFDERGDVLNLGSIGHLLLNLDDGIEYGGLSVEDESVGVGNVVLHLIGNAVRTEYGGIDSTILHGVVVGYDVRGNVATYAASARYHGTDSDAHSWVDDDAGGENDGVGYVAISCYFGAVPEYVAMAYFGVVGDVYAFHKEVVIADDGLSAGECGAVDDDVLADDVVVTDDEGRGVAAEVEVLRNGS